MGRRGEGGGYGAGSGGRGKGHSVSRACQGGVGLSVRPDSG